MLFLMLAAQYEQRFLKVSCWCDQAQIRACVCVYVHVNSCCCFFGFFCKWCMHKATEKDRFVTHWNFSLASYCPKVSSRKRKKKL